MIQCQVVLICGQSDAYPSKHLRRRTVSVLVQVAIPGIGVISDLRDCASYYIPDSSETEGVSRK